MAIARYWLTDKTAPFATFLNLLDAYYHPEIRHENFDALVQRARAAQVNDEELATFKQQFEQLLKGHREGLHPKALATAAGYDQRNDEEFLAWLWGELYPGEEVPGGGV